MSTERIGKLERWILITAYKKTVLHELPEGWKYPRFYNKYAQDCDKEIYNNHFSKVDILLNYFDLELSYRDPLDKMPGGYWPKVLDEKFKSTKKYKSALVSYHRILNKINNVDNEEESLLKVDYKIMDDLSVSCGWRQLRYSIKKGGWGANTRENWQYILTDKGIKKAEGILNINNCH